ncbi:hypothetical protein [Pseudohongiella acticola]|uniref:hypothetical protein n=1 Tax=Pseudohongiella acticola TaxID=1524254 RepID=UPI00111311E4|nr:hypothetical protein [Pseudohongiella acticola]
MENMQIEARDRLIGDGVSTIAECIASLRRRLDDELIKAIHPADADLTRSLIAVSFNGRDLELVGSVQIQSIELPQEGVEPFPDIEKNPCERLSLKAFLGSLRALVKKLTRREVRSRRGGGCSKPRL